MGEKNQGSTASRPRHPSAHLRALCKGRTRSSYSRISLHFRCCIRIHLPCASSPFRNHRHHSFAPYPLRERTSHVVVSSSTSKLMPPYYYFHCCCCCCYCWYCCCSLPEQNPPSTETSRPRAWFSNSNYHPWSSTDHAPWAAAPFWKNRGLSTSVRFHKFRWTE